MGDILALPCAKCAADAEGFIAVKYTFTETVAWINGPPTCESCAAGFFEKDIASDDAVKRLVDLAAVVGAGDKIGSKVVLRKHREAGRQVAGDKLMAGKL
jgi:hypothetical protein